MGTRTRRTGRQVRAESSTAPEQNGDGPAHPGPVTITAPDGTVFTLHDNVVDLTELTTVLTGATLEERFIPAP